MPESSLVYVYTQNKTKQKRDKQDLRMHKQIIESQIQRSIAVQCNILPIEVPFAIMSKN